MEKILCQCQISCICDHHEFSKFLIMLNTWSTGWVTMPMICLDYQLLLWGVGWIVKQMNNSTGQLSGESQVVQGKMLMHHSLNVVQDLWKCIVIVGMCVEGNVCMCECLLLWKLAIGCGAWILSQPWPTPTTGWVSSSETGMLPPASSFLGKTTSLVTLG